MDGPPAPPLGTVFARTGGLMQGPAPTAWGHGDGATYRELLELLRSCALTAPLGDEILQVIAGRLQPVRFEAGETIVREGQPGDRWFLIRDGMASVARTDLVGQEVTLAVLGPGETFGEMALITGRPRSATVRAATPVEGYALPGDDFRRLVGDHSAFAARVRQHIDLLELESFLKRASPFAQMPAEMLWRLAGQFQAQRVQAGETIIRQGDEADHFYLVRSGRVEVLRDRHRLAVLEAGDAFGEVALLTGQRRSATVRALEDTELLGLTRPEFEAVVREHSAPRNYFRELVRIRFRGAPGQPLVLPDPVTTVMPFVAPRRRRQYWLVLLLGAGTFALLTAFAALYGSQASLYSALAIGSFIGPVVFVVYLAESNLLAERPSALVATSVVAAVLGVPAAFALQREIGVAPGSLYPAAVVALIEEPVKVLGVFWVLHRSSLRFQMDGVIYGAAAGMGFAAFENVLYGLARVETVGVLLSTLWLRALLSPFTHGTWTAIICAAIWRERGAGLRRRGPIIALAFGTSILLHALWDWRPFPFPWSLLWLFLVGIVSVLILRGIVQRAMLEEMSSVLALNPDVARVGGRWPSLQCRPCGQVAPAGARYCPRCGRALRRVPSGAEQR